MNYVEHDFVIHGHSMKLAVFVPIQAFTTVSQLLVIHEVYLVSILLHNLNTSHSQTIRPSSV
jgi:hypothetical protein